MCRKLEGRWTKLLGVNMSSVSEASVGYSRATELFQKAAGEREERGEKAWKE